MTQPPNPITQGFRAARRDPALFLLEILWRWSFAAIALLLLFCAAVLLLDRKQWDNLAWAVSTRNPLIIGVNVFTTWLFLGKKGIVALAAVPFVIALVWTWLAAPARRITAGRLRTAGPLRFRTMLALQMLRAFVFWIAYLLLLTAVALAIHFATKGGKTDLSIFYGVAVPSVVLVILIWLILNWYLTMAAVFGQKGQGFGSAIRQARQTVRKQRSDFAGTAFVFLLFRLVVLLIAVAICGLNSKMTGTAPQTYVILLVVVVMAYSVVCSFLYIARMASYLALAAEHVEPGSPKLVASTVRQPAENPPSL
jgi:uncharacterized membrane protein (DUF485 family)